MENYEKGLDHYFKSLVFFEEMGDEDKNKLFKIDENFKMTGTAKEKGSGLGLILCKEFVEMHESEIQVESKPNQGTTVKFTLPVIQKS